MLPPVKSVFTNRTKHNRIFKILLIRRSENDFSTWLHKLFYIFDQGQKKFIFQMLDHFYNKCCIKSFILIDQIVNKICSLKILKVIILIIYALHRCGRSVSCISLKILI